MDVEKPKTMRISRQPSAIQTTGRPRCATVCYATIHNKDGCENRRTKISRNYNNFKKGATINTGCDLKEQHCQ